MAAGEGRRLSVEQPPGDDLAKARHVILDRDGVLNRELASGWLDDPREWRWEAGSLEALRELTRAGRRISVVTNQSGIGRGLVSRQAVEEVHDWLRREVERAGASVAAIFMCPHAPGEGCDCRKPRPGMVRKAVLESGISARETLLIGDDLRDLEAGRAAGVRVALVRTGKGESVRSKVPAGTPVFDDLLAAVRRVVGSSRSEPASGEDRKPQ